jgi:hypothetical protein
VSALELPDIRERVAQVRREANAGGDVVGGVPLEVVEALLEELDGALRHSGRGVRTAQGGVHVGPGRRDDACRQDLLEELDGLRRTVLLGRREAEADSSPCSRREIAGLDGLVEELAQLSLDRLRILGQAERQLRVGEAKLPKVDVPHVHARLEIVGGDAELRSELPQRLDGRLPRACLDPRDVGVRDARRRELSLRQLSLQA